MAKQSVLPSDARSRSRRQYSFQVFLWDRLATLAEENAGLITRNRLLVDILEAREATTAPQTADDPDKFPMSALEQTGVGRPWEEHTLCVRRSSSERLDEHPHTLAAAGVRDATRGRTLSLRPSSFAASQQRSRPVRSRPSRRAGTLRSAMEHVAD